MSASAAQTLDAKPNLMAHGRETEQKLNNKIHLRKALKSNPCLTKEIRRVLEQSLLEKLETLGINADIRGIPSDHFGRVLRMVESARHEQERHIPNIQQIENSLNMRSAVKLKREPYCPWISAVLLKWIPFQLERYQRRNSFRPEADH